MIVYEIRIPGRPPLLNAERSSHWRARHADTKAYRMLAAAMARRQKIPALDAVEVRSWPTYLDGRSWPDVAGWFPATKAVIDGLVDAHVLAHDRATVVRRNVFEAPRRGPRVELVVQVIPWARAHEGRVA